MLMFICMTEILAPPPVTEINVAVPAPTVEELGQQEVDRRFGLLIGSLAAEHAARETADTNPVVAVENDTLSPGDEISPDDFLEAMQPDTETDVFPESDDPYGKGTRTISEGRYHERLNWRLGLVGKYLDGMLPDIKSSSHSLDTWIKLKLLIHKVKQHGDVYRQVDEVKAIEAAAADFVQNVRMG